MSGLLTFFGVLVVWMAWMAEKNGKNAPWKWVGVVILVIAMWFGYVNYFSHMVGASTEDKLYRDTIPPIRRYTWSHYGAFVLPALAFLGSIILQFLKKPGAPATAPAAE